MCTCMSYRNPTYLAKVAATVDVVSGGRLEMGIGAGWYEHEWRAYGYGFPSAGERLAMLDEGVQIMRQMWTDGLGDVRGASTTRSTAPAAARCPLQAGGIPLWIAGGGEQQDAPDRRRVRGVHELRRHDSRSSGASPQVLAEHCRDRRA